MNQTVRLWGGRFAAPPDVTVMRLSSAAAIHIRLAPHDIAGGRAHADALLEAGLLSEAEHAQIVGGLAAILEDLTAGAIAPSAQDEDIHTFVERVLVERIGPAGGRLRLGRSRNDQAANDLKLYLLAECPALARRIAGLAKALADQAETHVDAVCPGFTHLQSAQPVTFGHLLMAHAQPLLRDLARLRDCSNRTSVSPLGAAALAGSSIIRHPERTAERLGYASSFENSIDAVAARDHIAEFLFVAAQTAVDVSRLAEDITLWTSRQFGWVALSDAFATGSSIMPQKKNPDVAEIARGRAARLVGDLVAMMTALKGLPLAYNRDLAEDKRVVFDAVDVLNEVLPALTGLIATMSVNVAAMRRQAADGHSLATEVADHLARRGLPFSEAHEIAGRLVRRCEERGEELENLTEKDLPTIDPRLDATLLAHLNPDAAVASRDGRGGTAPVRVREQIMRFRQTLGTVLGAWEKP